MWTSYGTCPATRHLGPGDMVATSTPLTATTSSPGGTNEPLLLSRGSNSWDSKETPSFVGPQNGVKQPCDFEVKLNLMVVSHMESEKPWFNQWESTCMDKLKYRVRCPHLAMGSKKRNKSMNLTHELDPYSNSWFGRRTHTARMEYPLPAT